MTFDPTPFITFMGLLIKYLETKGAQQHASTADALENYKEWLRRNDHSELVSLLEANREASIETAGILTQQHGEQMAMLSKLDGAFSSVAAHFPGTATIAAAINTRSRVSEQAVDILRQLNRLNASDFYVVRHQTGTICSTFDHPMHDLTIIEPRFLTDDIETMIEFGLLRETYRDDTRVFVLTRTGAELGK